MAGQLTKEEQQATLVGPGRIEYFSLHLGQMNAYLPQVYSENNDMKKSLTVIGILWCLTIHAISQEKKVFSITCNSGINGNFFVRSYDEENFPGFVAYYKKILLDSGEVFH
jgi:hypothetical protein